MKYLADAIIMQAIEDLWSEEFKRQSIDFFTGEGFLLCSTANGMVPYDKVRLLHLIREAVKNLRTDAPSMSRSEYTIAS
ncbi:MAG: hypothetical protein EPN25_10780 [Nitrospirae bacterium]|nr:MAG: hypothetical protein EPN25_10780 [Nitrospirota bacterium]